MNILVPAGLAMIVTLSGCNTLSLQERKSTFMAENDAYVAKSSDDLIRGKGVPTGVATLTDGSKVIEYYNAQVEIVGGETFPVPVATYHANPNGTGTWIYMNHIQSIPVRSWYNICRVDFFVNAKDVVESWKHEGKGCY